MDSSANRLGCSNKQHLTFVDGESEPTKLSILTGIDDEVFKSKAFQAHKFRDFIRYYLAQKATYLCPECLKESPHARFIWDCEINRVCPIHRCNLVNKCHQCSQTIKWLRSSVTECECGFDFRNSPVTNATDSQINFALYQAGCLGNAEHMKSVKAAYGEDNPLFCLTFEQFEQLSNFLKFDIRICLSHKGNLVMSQDVLNKFHTKSNLLSSGYYEEKLDLDRIEDWLPRVGRMLDCPELTLAKLIWVCQHIKSLHWLKDCSAWQIVLNRPLRKLIDFESKFNQKCYGTQSKLDYN